MSKNKGANANLVLKGKEGFEKYYSDLYGLRWPLLKDALVKDTVYATLSCGGTENYYLDPASVFAAMQLPLKGAERLLDMCAAPGGKTLVLAGRMDEDASLVSNERSQNRKQRLVTVCDTCLPPDIRERIKISCSDAAKWCTTQKECYERILLDAPCSSERHVLNDEKYLAEWSPNRIKSLAMEQWALLSCAYRLLEPDGYLLYSTCALAKAENDGVVERLLKKFDDVEFCFRENEPIIPEDYERTCKMDFIPKTERTSYGFHILPDMQSGAGPIWFTLIHKKNR